MGWPILFKQPRPGKNEKIFNMYKFRTMTNKKNKEGVLLPDEERINKFGKFLRMTSLDELPKMDLKIIIYTIKKVFKREDIVLSGTGKIENFNIYRKKQLEKNNKRSK